MSTHKKHRFKSLKHFVRDGAWSSVCEGVAESNFSSFAVFLNATAPQIGMLNSSQQLLGCWLQLWSEKLIGVLGSRKRLVLACVMAQSVALGLMIFCAATGLGMWPFFVLATVFTGFGSLSSPAWNTWVAELLPNRRRGACFSVRNRVTHPANFAALVAGGLMLDHLGALKGGQLAFSIVFLFGLVSKVLALWHLHNQQEHPVKFYNLRRPGPIAMLREVGADRRMRRVVLFFAAIAFAVNISGAFQAAFVLKSLKFTYSQFTFLLGIMALARFLAAPVVGRIVDRMGSRKLLSISAALLPLNPLGWCISQNYYFMMLNYFSAGVIWAAFDLCAFTYLAECVQSSKRPRVFAAKHFAWGLMSFVGAALGSTLIETGADRVLTALTGVALTHGTLVVFWISFISRAIAASSAMVLPDPRTLRFEEPELPIAPQPEPAPAAAA